MNGKSALVGHSGFVGGTLLRASPFDDLYNSSNIADVRGRSYDLLVCAGVSAAKWLANRDPEADRRAIVRLTDALAHATVREFILISTIDVYPDPDCGADESSLIDPAVNHAYGAHRFQLEQWVRDHFANVRIVRLPALFGEGLRKNAMYDLLNGNDTTTINPLGAFQWYPMSRLARDIERARAADLRLVNLFPEPVAMSDVIDAFFPTGEVGPPRTPAPRYDTRSRHAAVFGGENGYILNAETTLGELARFVASERRRIRGES